MIAAAGRRVGSSLERVSRRLDRLGNRSLERAHPPLRRAGRTTGPAARRARAAAAPVLALLALLGRRGLGLLFAALATGERGVRALLRLALRAATALSAVATPRRAVAATIVAAAGALIASQFIDYRGVEIGGAAYAGLPDAAQPPAVAVKTAGEAHSYLLVPLAALAGALGVWAGRARARPRLGLPIAALGLIALAVVLLVDLPAGLDVGGQSARFAGASAVLDQGFYAELAAAAGLAIAGVLYYARPCRIRISSSGRAASARRRRPRRPDSSPAKVARSA
ncbi:MAG: hypothetical protein AB7F97_18765 [Solirubrobacterales bacterium]